MTSYEHWRLPVPLVAVVVVAMLAAALFAVWVTT